MLKLVRVDERLLHGQVAIGWTSNSGANTILVANDEAQKDKVKAMALNLAKPAGVTLYIRSVAESGPIVEKFASAKKAQVLVLVRNIQDALQLIKNSNGTIKELNVGGLKFEEGKKKLNDYVAVSDQDIEDLKEIQKLGVELDFRMLPRDKKLDLDDLLKE
ncbi:PTS sugar transporter subunit IIB [Lactobacillus sp. M0403]|uniref:PTS sugar transporter subunit IIB n=1 Tax=Lactobacillus TaxID=1578 RepID=UPI0008162DBB|nr:MULTISPECIES: PTS sugar transporter subunit IIB [Lactobacillus]MBC6361763.1 PTS mannose/fructose/sorbose transporter subunit IIB [Lactobacillus apis]MBI0093453.1 PTS sugar transporter subunit IIB [Lactobacillus sp. M0403]MCT6877509.1 PTS sugar transporter subunit IIB [Lactobacillus apis]RMC51485.1 PTS mannose/fructose/sorbose transporter subunit IIB [Lactobacillus sp. ESL0263]SCB95951.1 PTS system, mannose-specific IIB component [Lactobacillus apis]